MRWCLAFLLSVSLMAGRPPRLGPKAQAMLAQAFEGLPEGPLVDVHTHLVGLGADGTGAWVNPEKLSWGHPLKRLQTKLYIGASGVKDLTHFDRDYEAMLVARATAFGHPLRIHLLAFDRVYDSHGNIDPKRTEFFVPNEYLIEVAARHPDLFVPTISVHPARPDALQELERWAARGVRYVKWLPNAQNIDPADPRYDAFYQTMKSLGMVLLSHVGEEKAVKATEAQKLGNPLKFRRALDLGLTVIMAHCASLGTNDDLDHPGQRATNFELFLRLMDDPKYKGQLWGDISAITQVNRLPKPLLTLLERPDLHARLVNGSDYPLPGVNLVIWTRKLVSLGLLTPEERKALNEIFRMNPLLFDFVLKRTLHTKDGKRLDPAIFVARPELPVGQINN